MVEHVCWRIMKLQVQLIYQQIQRQDRVILLSWTVYCDNVYDVSDLTGNFLKQ